MDWRKARMYLELRQADVANATGITIQRLSLAERGMVTLNRVELASLEDFLRSQLEAEFERMGGKGKSPRAQLDDTRNGGQQSRHSQN
jgi:transcriptional regulator with XRE-family HTH domain